MSKQFDLIVLGSGPGGYVAAIRAAQLGLKTAVVEKDPKFGGTCLHRGCIPTKALLHAAATLDEIRGADHLGIRVAEPKLDLEKTHGYKDKVVGKNAKGIEFLFKKNKIEGIHGRGRLVGDHEVEVEDPDGKKTTYHAKHILIATGSVPREIPPAPTDGVRIINSDHALKLDHVPKSLVVLGAGAVGTEFASIFNSFGSKVTVVEMLPRLLPIEDEEVSKELRRSFRKRKIDVMTDTKLKAVDVQDDGVLLALEREGLDSGLAADMLLVAVGRAAGEREPRARSPGHQDRTGLHRCERAHADGGAPHLRHRRRGEHPVARPRGLERRHSGGGAHGGAGSAAPQLRPRAVVHLLPARGGERGAHGGGGEGARLRGGNGQVPVLSPGQGGDLADHGGLRENRPRHEVR